MPIYERIKKRRKELGLSADAVAECLGVSRATVYRYESAEIEKLPLTLLEPLSEVLRCSPAYLMGWDENTHIENNNFNENDAALVKKYHLLNDVGKKKLDEQLEDMLSIDKYKINSKAAKIPYESNFETAKELMEIDFSTLDILKVKHST